MHMEDPATEPTVIAILIDDIVLVEEEEISARKTTLAVGSGIGVIALIAAAIFIYSLMQPWYCNTGS